MSTLASTIADHYPNDAVRNERDQANRRLLEICDNDVAQEEIGGRREVVREPIVLNSLSLVGVPNGLRQSHAEEFANE